jgi:16S rRNA (guanine527-N7)-methyltransferase
MTPSDFARRFSVSRETLDQLSLYASLLAKWNPTINLVARSTLNDMWGRHFADSAQLQGLIPAGTRVLVDLGSGGGFPGLVLAILGVPQVHLIESDQRKCAFLREVARATGAPVTIHARRIEDVDPVAANIVADVVSARALADLPTLMGFAARFLGPDGVCLFPKGRNAAEELTRARDCWTMTAEEFPSFTDPEARILRLSGLARTAS